MPCTHGIYGTSMSRTLNVNKYRCRAFRIWIGKLGYKIKPMKGDGFYFRCGNQNGYMTDNYRFDKFAEQLMLEYLAHTGG